MTIRTLKLVLLSTVLAGVLCPGTSSASFPGANGKIAYAKERDGLTFISTMDVDGSNSTLLTTGTVVDQSPSWSADGSQLAFSRLDLSTASEGIAVSNSDGSSIKMISSPTSPNTDRSPTWSPDGSKIAFVAEQVTDGAFVENIWVMDRHGANRKAITNQKHTGVDGPTWSPDGSKIAFSRVVKEGGDQIVVASADGGSEKALTPPTASIDFDPDWSPDGSKLVLSRWIYNDGPDVIKSQIVMVNSDGTNQQAVVDESSVSSGPIWSPDGAAVAFELSNDNDSNNKSIIAMSPDGSGQHVITSFDSYTATTSSLAWQPLPTVHFGGRSHPPSARQMIKLRTRKARVGRSLRLKVRCLSSTKCLGRITLSVNRKRHGSRKRSVELTHRNFSVAGGKTATVTLHLNRSTRRLLKRQKYVMSNLSLKSGENGASTRFKQKIKLLQP